MPNLRKFLLVSSAIPLAACGADDVASPGEGVIVIPAPTPVPVPAPAPAPAPTPTPTTGPAANCPAGTTSQGVIADRRNCQLPSRITGTLTLENLPGVIYSFSGRTDVGVDVGGDGQAANGQQGILNINAGVIIFAASGADFLVVNRGSKIFAEGTQNNPVIFTSRDNIQGAATDNSSNQWGGVLLLGRAPISNCDADVEGGSAQCQKLAEGTGSDAFYGGDVENDDSGNFRFVQIRYTGFSLKEGDELQGLTTGGVGSGTDIQYVQSHNSGDDGIEIFGGRHNLRYIVITGADDDTFDTDFGYKGATQFMIGVQRQGAGDYMIEADSDDGGEDLTPRQFTKLANFTFIHVAEGETAIRLRGGTDYALLNGVVVGVNICLDVDQPETVQTAGPDENGEPIIRSVAFDCPTIIHPDDDTFEQDALDRPGNDNNVLGYTNSLTNLFVNGPEEDAVTPVADLTAIDPFFVNVSYIGAVQSASDTWYRGWTCDATYVDFGSGQACAAVPQNTA